MFRPVVLVEGEALLPGVFWNCSFNHAHFVPFVKFVPCVAMGMKCSGYVQCVLSATQHSVCRPEGSILVKSDQRTFFDMFVVCNQLQTGHRQSSTP